MENAETDLALSSVAFGTTFDNQQDEDATNAFAIEEGLNGLATAVGIGGALLGLLGPVGGAIGGAVGALVTGVVGGVNTALAEEEDLTIDTIADFQS